LRISLSSLRGDIFGGVTTAVVALPLALAFGVTSGLGPIAGLYGAIAVGFFAAIFGGTRTQISGPTGPMTVVMAAIVAQHADKIETAFAIVFLGGAMQILFGALRVGRYVSYTPYSVISGFMSGVGVIIILIQTLPFVGLMSAPGGPLGAIRMWPEALTRFSLDALLIASASLAVMIFWPRPFRRYLPPALAALAVGTALSLTLLTGAPVIGEVPTGLPEIRLPSIGLGDLTGIIQPAFVLALLGTIDSLLTSLVADSITRTHHNSNRELIGQGIGNMVAGLIGAVPGAGATMRTVINVRSGGTSPISGALHAIILLALVLGLGPLTGVIPHAALAGILMKVGWDIIDWGYLKRIRWAPRDKLLVMFVTLILTVFVDLITAVAVGLILAGFVTANWMEREELKGVTMLALSDEESLDETERAALQKLAGSVLLVTLRGRFSYASARELTKRIGPLATRYEAIILDLTGAAHVDTSAAMAIDELIQSARSDKIRCVLAGLSGPAEVTLKSLGVLDNVNNADIAPSRIEAIHRVADHQTV
jgi:SulP family sulfate permease